MVELSKEDFRQWLVEKEPDEVVGSPTKAMSCPGARWLQDRGFECANLSATRFMWLRQGWHSTTVPQWLTNFIDCIDTKPSPVTAKDCLEVLDSLDVS